MKLTDKACKGAKKKDKAYKLFDGGGLYLEVLPTGSKLWRLKYYYLGTEKRISFGAYPLVSLADARIKRDDAKRLLLNDKDPSTNREEKRQEIIRNAERTFKASALEWFDTRKGEWSEVHAKNVWHRLETDIFPYIGNRPIASIDAQELLSALRKIEERGALDIAGRTKGICGQVFTFAKAKGICASNPADGLNQLMVKKKPSHFAAIDAKQIPEFLAAVDRNDARLFHRTRRAIWLSMLTFVRPGELRQAQWDEIDLIEGLWIIPASRMKMKRDHVVPLSRQAIVILRDQGQETGMLETPWVFPHQRRFKEPMSDGAVLEGIKQLGFRGKMTAHGFRALARTTIREKLKYKDDVIEAQLAHMPAGPLGRAYNRAEHLDERKAMMQDWANYIESLSKGGQVIAGNFKKRA